MGQSVPSASCRQSEQGVPQLFRCFLRLMQEKKNTGVGGRGLLLACDLENPPGLSAHVLFSSTAKEARQVRCWGSPREGEDASTTPWEGWTLFAPARTCSRRPWLKLSYNPAILPVAPHLLLWSRWDIRPHLKVTAWNIGSFFSLMGKLLQLDGTNPFHFSINKSMSHDG